MIPSLHIDQIRASEPGGLEIRVSTGDARLILIIPGGWSNLAAITRGALPCLARYSDGRIDGPQIADALSMPDRVRLRQMVANLAPVEVA